MFGSEMVSTLPYYASCDCAFSSSTQIRRVVAAVAKYGRVETISDPNMFGSIASSRLKHVWVAFSKVGQALAISFNVTAGGVAHSCSLCILGTTYIRNMQTVVISYLGKVMEKTGV